MDPTDIDQVLEQKFTSLSPRLQHAARYVVDHPEEVALNSMRTIAGLAGVDPSSMIRLAREIGFSSYEEFRNQYRSRLLSGTATWSGRARRLRDRKPDVSGAAALVREIANQDQINLQQAFADETITKLEEAKHLFLNARRVYVMGLRSLFPVAFYFHYVCRLFSTKTVLLTGTGGTLADDLRFLENEDILFLFSYRPYARDAVRALSFARSKNAKIVGVTDSKVSPIARDADVAIIVSNVSPSLLPTIIPSLAVAQAVANAILSESDEDAIRQIERSEQQLQRFSVYAEDGRPKGRRPR
jgi:DNA-binding MurR/RpiR family transcriptional regulator